MFKRFLSKFWVWYEKYYLINLAIAAGLFLLQLLHLYWLTTNVVAMRLFDRSFFNPGHVWESFIILVDYTEIPALISTSLVYINELRKKFNFKSLLYLIFLNSQWLHIYWITDEFVVENFSGEAKTVALTFWLAWVAILIDYLELPVIYDTVKKLIRALKDRNLKEVSEVFE